MRLSVTILLAAILLLPLSAQPKRQAGSLTISSTQIVPLVIVGEGWSQSILLANVDRAAPTVGTVRFFTKDGDPWIVAMKDGSRANTFLLNLAIGESTTLETSVSQAPQQLGWARIETSSSGDGDYFGQTIFRKQTAGLPDFMCSMVLGGLAFEKLTIPFDNTGGKYTGAGILTSELCTFSCSLVSLKVTVRDQAGRVISQKTISQKSGTLYWMNLATDFPDTANRAGLFTIEPASSFSTELTGVSLQFAPNGAFTAITPFED